jgi:hypothetical protein
VLYNALELDLCFTVITIIEFFWTGFAVFFGLAIVFVGILSNKTK